MKIPRNHVRLGDITDVSQIRFAAELELAFVAAKWSWSQDLGGRKAPPSASRILSTIKRLCAEMSEESNWIQTGGLLVVSEGGLLSLYVNKKLAPTPTPAPGLEKG